MNVFLRIGFASAYISLFVAARVLALFPDPPAGATLLFAAELIACTVSTGALLAMHHQEKSSPVWLAAGLLYPLGIYVLLGGSPDWTEKLVWMFWGDFLGLTIIGGFLGGVFLSPVFASIDSPTAKGIGEWIRVGVSFIRGLGLAGFALALFVLTGIALYFLWKRLAGYCPSGPEWQGIVFWLGLLLPTLAVIRFTYRHTLPHLLKDRRF